MRTLQGFEHTTKTPEVKGVHTVPSTSEEALVVGGHLQSMYLFPRLRETTIGEFLRSHPDIVKSAFCAKEFYYEPYLEWQERGPAAEDSAINPDMILQREDGSCDIFDLKTAQLERRSIVKGPRRRRRFIDYVEEGAAQLAHYREYFSYPRNQEYAKAKFGMDVRSPTLYLIVGSWENAREEELREAVRRYADIQIIDFDTVAHMFYRANEQAL